VNLVLLINNLKSPNMLVLMFLRISQGEPKPQRAKNLLFSLDSLNKFLKVLINELPNALPPYKEVDHKIEMVFVLASSPKAPYRLKKELEEL
jgi:hypothetical protein